MESQDKGSPMNHAGMEALGVLCRTGSIEPLGLGVSFEDSFGRYETT